jgi:tetratricopeptide repeat protein
MTTAAAATSPAASRWLFGPVPDLVFGCGVGYGLIFVLQSVAGPQMREVLPLALSPLLTLFVSVPHYGATLLRVYEQPRERRKYAVFAVWLTASVAAAFVTGLSVPLIGGWMITLYLTWSPWHYTGQNYGVALMFLGRRGVRISPRAKQLFKWSFWLSFGLAFLAIHGPSPIADYQPAGLGGGEYRFQPLGIPGGIRDAALVGVGGAYVVVTAAALWLLSRAGRVRDLVPAIVMIATQALWFVVPALVRRWGLLAGVEPLSVHEIPYTFLWVAVGHAVQYLWITAYYARREDPAMSYTSFFGKTAAAGIIVWTLPALAFAPGVLGSVPFDAGLALMVAAGVNLHHFILDGAIWKLRDGRIARILIRADGPVEGSPGAPPRSVWPRRLTWAIGALFFVGSLGVILESYFGFTRAIEGDRPDVARAERAVERLRLVGRDSSDLRTKLGIASARAGDLAATERNLRRALALRPNPLAWTTLGALHARRSEWDDAEKAYDQALGLDPDYPAALLYAGKLHLGRGDMVRAREMLEHALESARTHPDVDAERRANLRAAAQSLLSRTR